MLQKAVRGMGAKKIHSRYPRPVLTLTVRADPVADAPIQAALVHVRWLPLGVREGLREVCGVLAGAGGHLEHADAALGWVHVLPKDAQDGFLVPLCGRRHQHNGRVSSASGPTTEGVGPVVDFRRWVRRKLWACRRAFSKDYFQKPALCPLKAPRSIADRWELAPTAEWEQFGGVGLQIPVGSGPLSRKACVRRQSLFLENTC